MYHPKAHNQIPIMSRLTCNDHKQKKMRRKMKYLQSLRRLHNPPPPTPSSGRRSTRRPVSNEVVYNTRMWDFMEKILKRTEPPTKNPFEKKVNDFCLVLENLMLKQPDSIFDAFMIDCLGFAQEYNPTTVEVMNQRNVKVLGAISSHAAFKGKQPTQTFANNINLMLKQPESIFDACMICLRFAQEYNPTTVEVMNQSKVKVLGAITSHGAFKGKHPTKTFPNFNTTSFTGNIGNSTNPSPVGGGLSANAPLANKTTAEIHYNFKSLATQSQEQSELDIMEGAQQIEGFEKNAE